MGKTRDLFKKIRDTKGTFHAKMGTIKDRNGIDQTEAEDIKKRWHVYALDPVFSFPRPRTPGQIRLHLALHSLLIPSATYSVFVHIEA